MLCAINEALSGRGVYVVGGAVRDMLLGRNTCDIDLLLPAAQAAEIRVALAQVLQTAGFPLKADQGLYRFQSKVSELKIDVAPFEGDVRDNMAGRDFTQNAMAMPLADFVAGRHDALIDPYAGSADIALSRLRMVTPSAFRDDPVRILRAARFIAELRMVPTADLLSAARQSARGLRNCPGERVWTELVRLFSSAAAPKALDFLDEVSAQAVLFSELEAQREITQGQHHSYGVYEHSRRVFAAFVELWHRPDVFGSELAPLIAEHLASLSPGIVAACMLGGLLHDIGKPAARTQRENGRISFYRHEHLGAAMAPPIAQRLRMSKTEGRVMANFIRLHTLPTQVARMNKRGDLHLHRLGRRLGRLSVPLTLFTIADLRGKAPEASEGREFDQMVDALSHFLRAWFFRHSEVMAPHLPVDGEAIAAALGLTPGRWLRETLDYLAELQACGAGLDRESALREAARFISKNEKK
jgi:poly(A) polymerase